MRFAFVLILVVQFSELSFSQTRLSPCKREGKSGFCTESGEVKIPCIYDQALPFTGPLAAVEIKGFWWMIHQSGLLRFNTHIYAHDAPPTLERGLYKVQYFDPIFADVTEYYNRNGLPVKPLENGNPYLDTTAYEIFEQQKAINIAQSKLGTPYGQNGMDCSGFIRFIFSSFGIILPYYTYEIAGKGREISQNEAKPGDLVLFTGSNPADQKVGHIGMIIGGKGNAIQFIHASSSKGVSINRLKDSYYQTRFLGLRRLFD